MSWAKVDDRLFSHPKWVALPKGGKALWVTALSWCAGQATDGFVPGQVLPLLGASTADARALVAAGMWENADGGYQFHDWTDYQPDAASTGALRAKKSSGGREGNHRRWHTDRGVTVEGCEFCESEDRSEDRSEGQIGVRIGSESSRTRTRTHKGGRPAREARPAPDMAGPLVAASLPPTDHEPFLQALRDNGIRRPPAYVMQAHHDELSARIKEWQDERDREAKTPRIVTAITAAAPRDEAGRAVYDIEECPHGGEKGRCPMCRSSTHRGDLTGHGGRP